MKIDVPALPFGCLQLAEPPQIFASEPNWHWAAVIPAYYNLWIALEGVGEIECEGVAFPVRAGIAFLFAPGLRVSARHDPQHPIRNFAGHVLLPVGLDVGCLLGVSLQDFAGVKEMCRVVVQVSRKKDSLAQQQVEGLCYQLLAQLWRDGHSPALHEPDTALLDVAARMVERPWQWRTSDEMAHEAGYSIAQFNRRFLALLGCSPAQYAIAQRMRRAKELLEQSSMQVGEIADALGYNDIYYFSRQFKGAVGVSPQGYRRG